jgi:hypothetical protein
MHASTIQNANETSNGCLAWSAIKKTYLCKGSCSFANCDITRFACSSRLLTCSASAGKLGSTVCELQRIMGVTAGGSRPTSPWRERSASENPSPLLIEGFRSASYPCGSLSIRVVHSSPRLVGMLWPTPCCSPAWLTRFIVSPHTRSGLTQPTVYLGRK